MQVSSGITFIWTSAVILSMLLSIVISNITLKRKYSSPKNITIYTIALIIGYAATYTQYSHNVTVDFVAVVGTSVIACIACILASSDNLYAKIFISVMSSLIANVATFFFAGNTIALIDNATNPYNLVTIIKFMLIKIVIFTIIVICYKKYLLKIVRQVIDILDTKISHYIAISLILFFGFYAINLITNKLGIFPAIPEMRIYFLSLYGVICTIFVFEYYQIFSSAIWSSRALKTEAELNVASKIQKDMLPCIFPAFPERKEFDIHAIMDPAKEVGGDFYDFFLIDDDHLAIVIADVSGKGVPAALFMVISKTLIKNYAQIGLSLSDVFTMANNQLCENNEEGLFVTAWMGVLEISTGKFSYVNAGHNPPLLKRNNGDFEYLKCKPGFVLAGIEDFKYKQDEMHLDKGDTVFLYTDGVTEANNNKNDLYSEERLLNKLNDNKNEPISNIISKIRQDVDLFAGEIPQFDDITMLGIKINLED